MFPSQTNENKLIKTRIGIHSGVCIHNGIVHKNRDEWTVDDCTECTCQVCLITYLNSHFSHGSWNALCLHKTQMDTLVHDVTSTHVYAQTMTSSQLMWSDWWR